MAIRRNSLMGFNQSHAILVGINQYPHIEGADLTSAVPDTWELARTLWTHQGFDHVWLLINPNQENFQQVLDWMKDSGRENIFPLSPDNHIQNEAQAREVQDTLFHEDNFKKEPNLNRLYYFQRDPEIVFEGIKPEKEEGNEGSEEDSFLFYYAAHGQANVFEEGPVGFLFPSDVTDSARMDKRIPMQDLHEALDGINCKHTLLILDCCFAGAFRHTDSPNRTFSIGNRKPISFERFERFKRKRAWQVLVSSGPNQTSADWMGDRGDEADGSGLIHSPFAGGLIKALRSGKADFTHPGETRGDGVITATELRLHLFDLVEERTRLDENFPIQNPDLFPMSTHQGGEFIFVNPDAHEVKFAKWRGQNPYMGLKPFEQNVWPFFMGRDTVVEEVYAKLKNMQFLVITGASAQGKSSLVQAGLFPKLVAEGYQTHILLPHKRPYSSEAVILPEEDKPGPTKWSGIKAFEEAILDSAPASLQVKNGEKHIILIDQYESFFSQGYVYPNAPLTGEKPTTENEFELFQQRLDFLHAVIDLQRIDFQAYKKKIHEFLLEESDKGPLSWASLLGEIEDMEQQVGENSDLIERLESAQEHLGELSLNFRRALVDDVLHLWRKVNASLKIVITLRSDYEWQFTQSIIGQLLERYNEVLSADGPYLFRYRLGPMALDELREALIGPGLIQDYEFESEELIGEILEEISYAPAALSLLSFTMQRMFKLTQDKGEQTFTRETYKESLGGVAGALSKHADEIYETLPVAHRLVLKKIMLRMVQINGGEFARSRIMYNPLAPLHELDYPDENFDEMRKDVIEKLTEAQLFVSGDNPQSQLSFVEPAHDALINHWPVCRKWIEDYGRDNLMLHIQLWQAVLDQDRFIGEFSSAKGRRDIRGELIPAPSVAEDFLTQLWDSNPKLLQIILQLLGQLEDETKRGDLVLTLQKWRDSLSQEEEEAHQALIHLLKIGKKMNPDLGEEEITPIGDEGPSDLLSIEPQIGQLPGISPVATDLDAFIDKSSLLEILPVEVIEILLEFGEHNYNSAEMEFISASWTRRQGRIAELLRQQKVLKEALDKAEARALAQEIKSLPRKLLSQSVRLGEYAWDKYLTEEAPEPPLSIQGALTEQFCLQTASEVYPIAQPFPHKIFPPQEQISHPPLFLDHERRVLISYTSGKTILWNWEGKPIFTLEGHDSGINKTLILPNEEIVTCSADGTGKLWSASGNFIRIVARHDSGIVDADWGTTPFGGLTLATATEDGKVALWSLLEEEKLFKTYSGHNKQVNSVRFLHNILRSLLTSSDDGTVRVWNFLNDTAEIIEDQEERYFLAEQQELFKNGRRHTYILTLSEFSAKIWQLNWDWDGVATQANWEPEGPIILTAPGKETWDKHTQKILHGAFSHKGDKIVTCSEDRTAIIWNLDGRALHILRDHTDIVTYAHFSKEDRKISTSSRDRVGRVWDVETGRLEANLIGHTATLAGVVFDDQSVSSNSERDVLSWDINGGVRNWNLEGEGVYWTHDRPRKPLFSPTSTDWIRLQGPQVIRREIGPDKSETHYSHEDIVVHAAYSPDGQWIVSGSKDRTAKIWARETKGAQTTLTGHTSTVTYVEFSQQDKGEHLLTASADHSGPFMEMDSQ